MSQNNKIEEQVMAGIKSGKIKLRSRYIFLAEKLGIGSAFIFSIILAALFFNLLFFYLKASDNLMYLSFGSRGLFAFFESFPYLLVVILILAIFIAGLIIKKTGLSYKKPFGYMAVGLVLLAMIGGGALTFAKVAERIEARMNCNCPSEMFFRPLLSNDMEKRNSGLAGRINEIGEDFITVQTPRDIIKIDISKLEKELETDLSTGLFVIAVGEKKGDVFEAKNIKIVNEDEMPMIRRGVNECFGPPEDRRNIPLNILETEGRVGGCLMEKKGAGSCSKNCFVK